MGYLLLAVVGTGTKADPFRPLFPVTVPPMTEQPGFRWTAHIPSKPDGTPQFTNCYVWIPDSFIPPVGVIFEPLQTARTAITSRDSGANVAHMEKMP